MKSLRERTEIQQAFLDGKQIKYNCGTKWILCQSEPLFDWHLNDYRIKDDPMVIYLSFYDGKENGRANDRDSLIERIGSFDRIIKLVEVIE